VKTQFLLALLVVIPIACPALADEDRKPQSAYIRQDLDWQPVSMARPSALSLEMAGHGLAYSVNYDHSLGPNFAIGAGIGYLGLTGADLSASVTTIPVYANYYPIGDEHRPFITAGATFVTISGSIAGSAFENRFEGSATALAPMAGIGYEYRGTEGFLFRISPYLVITPLAVLPWAGLSLGATF
jgi:hypothetical protein